MKRKHYLLASDFDQTLSFNDSGLILSQLIGASDFTGKVTGLSRMHFIQQGGELAYLLLHDPEYRCVRREHLVEVGKQIRLKANIRLLSQLLDNIEGYQFSFYVISAAPEEVIQSALEGIVPPDHIHGTRFHFDSSTGEIQSIIRVPAGYGKVAVLEELKTSLEVSDDRVVYVGDGGSDIHVMLHVNRSDGLTVAVSEAKYVTRIALCFGADSRGACRLGAAANSRSVRIARLRAAGVGESSDGLAHHPRRNRGGRFGRSLSNRYAGLDWLGRHCDLCVVLLL